MTLNGMLSALQSAGRNKTLYALSAEVPDGSLIITVQPKSYTGPISSMATFTVAANYDDVSYQWQYRKPGNEWKNSGTAAATTATMTVEVTETRDGQAYRCIVTRDGETVTSFPATMTVGAASNRGGAFTSQQNGRLDAPDGDEE